MGGEFEGLSIRGGGLLGGFFKWVLGPLAVLILPIVTVCGWASETDLSYLVSITGLILGIFLALALLIDLMSFISFHIKIQGNGDFEASNAVQNREGVLNIHRVTRVEMHGALCRLYEGEEPVCEWSTKPISLKNMGRFLRGLMEVNPRIKLGAKCAEIAEKGRDNKLQRSFLRGGGLLFLLSFAGILWFPTLEVLVLRVILGKFTWFQKALMGNIFLTLAIPYSFIYVFGLAVWFIRWKWLPEAVEKKVKVSLAVLAVLGVLAFHMGTLLDFWEGPAELKNQIPQIQSVKYSRDNKDMIHFVFPSAPDKDWSIECYQQETPQVRALLKGPVNMYYSRRTGYMVRVEDSTGKSPYTYNRE